MIKPFIFSLILFPFLLIGQDTVKNQLNTFLDEWHDDASKADMEAYFSKIDTDGIYIGTDATENWSKQAFYDWSKPYFDNGKAWTFKAFERNIYLSDDGALAWFDEQLKTSSAILRGSGVLRFKNGEWKIIHYVLSLPVPNERFKEVIEIINSK